MFSDPPRLFWRVVRPDGPVYIPATKENSEGEFPNMKYSLHLDDVSVEITREILEMGKSVNGAYSKAQRAALGIEPPWPPSLMPIEDTIGKIITATQFVEFMCLKNAHLDENSNDAKRKSRKATLQQEAFSLLPDYYPKDAPTVFTTKSGLKDVDREKGRFDPAWDEPGGPRIQRQQKCPSCESLNVKAVGTGGAECNSCGFILS